MIRETKQLGDDTVAQLEKVLNAFKATFTTSSGELLVKDVRVEATEDEDIDPTQIKRRV